MALLALRDTIVRSNLVLRRASLTAFKPSLVVNKLQRAESLILKEELRVTVPSALRQTLR